MPSWVSPSAIFPWLLILVMGAFFVHIVLSIYWGHQEHRRERAWEERCKKALEEVDQSLEGMKRAMREVSA